MPPVHPEWRLSEASSALFLPVLPALCIRGGSAKQIHNPFHAAVHDIHNSLRPVIEAWNRGSYDCPHFSQRNHRPQMAEMKRHLANHQNQASSLFQSNVSRAYQKVG